MDSMMARIPPVSLEDLEEPEEENRLLLDAPLSLRTADELVWLALCESPASPSQSNINLLCLQIRRGRMVSNHKNNRKKHYILAMNYK